MRKKCCILLLIIILLVSLLSVNALAADLSFTTTMTPSSTKVDEATEVVVTVSVSNLSVGDNGINSFSAYLNYDTTVFETLTDSSVEGLNSWSSTYSTSSGQVVLVKNSFVNSDEEIMQISLKVKSGVDDGTSGTVSLTNIVASNSEDDISGTNVSTTITVGTASTTVNPSTNSTTNSNSSSSSGNTTILNITTNNNTSTTTNATNSSNLSNNTNSVASTSNSTGNSTGSVNSTSNVSSSSNEVTDSDIVYTGTESSAFIKIILGVILVSLAIYIKIRRLEEIK